MVVTRTGRDDEVRALAGEDLVLVETNPLAFGFYDVYERQRSTGRPIRPFPEFMQTLNELAPYPPLPGRKRRSTAAPSRTRQEVR
jgi:hypothetical protein